MATYSTNYTCNVYLVDEDFADQYLDRNSSDDQEVGDFSEEDDEYFPRDTLVSMDVYVDINPNEPEMIFHHFDVTSEDIIHNLNSYTMSLLYRMLLSMHIPTVTVIVMMFEIEECARRILRTRPHSRTINMVVALSLRVDDDAVFLESFDSEPLRFVPASESSIEGLEKVRVEEVSEQCTVCLEEILVGSEATTMPCNHVYHGSCIKNWLRISNHCPLCRFPMPST